MMKKLIPIIIVSALLLSLAACGGEAGAPTSTAAATAASTAATTRVTIPATESKNPDVSEHTYIPAAFEKFGIDLSQLTLPDGCTFRDVVRNGSEDNYSLLVITYHCPLDAAADSAQNIAAQLFEQTQSDLGGSCRFVTDPETGSHSTGAELGSLDECSETDTLGFAGASWGYNFGGEAVSVLVKPYGYYNTFEIQLNSY